MMLWTGQVAQISGTFVMLRVDLFDFIHDDGKSRTLLVLQLTHCEVSPFLLGLLLLHLSKI